MAIGTFLKFLFISVGKTLYSITLFCSSERRQYLQSKHFFKEDPIQ
jgi:hypothetical protein